MAKMWTETRELYLPLTQEDKDDLIQKMAEADETLKGLEEDLEETTKQLKASIKMHSNTREESVRKLTRGRMSKTVLLQFEKDIENKKLICTMPDGTHYEQLERALTPQEIEAECQTELPLEQPAENKGAEEGPAPEGETETTVGDVQEALDQPALEILLEGQEQNQGEEEEPVEVPQDETAYHGE